MRYFVKKSTPSKKGVYLQIYQSGYVSGKGSRNKSYKKLGYVDELKNDGIDDPYAYAQEMVDELNKKHELKKEQQIGDVSLQKNAGHFLAKLVLDKLAMDKDINIVASNYKCHYDFSSFIRTMIYAQIVSPGSKLKAFEKVIPSLYDSPSFSYDQILDGIDFLGSDYPKFIEVMNHHIAKNWKRSYDTTFFDCTNYYFEIDAEDDLRKKGVSKERRHDPIVSQALILDADMIPLDMRMYPGNESEKPKLREAIETLKEKHESIKRVIQVADKGLNCARNIYAAVKEANDGYIFSKAVKGLTDDEKKWLNNEFQDINKFVDVKDNEGNLLFRYKVVKDEIKGKIVDYSEYEYHCKINPEDTKEEYFKVYEKRIATYNPKLARKQRREILRQVEKLKSKLTCGTLLKEELGDACKYISKEITDENGEIIKGKFKIDQKKVDEDLALAGFNMLITSELDADPIQIYKTYHCLWRIEHCFRVMKTYLEARPAFLSDSNKIYGHFTIVYLALTIMRLMELKVFNEEICIEQLFEFMRGYTLTEDMDGNFINNALNGETHQQIKKKFGLAKLGNAYLSKKDVEKLFKYEF